MSKPVHFAYRVTDDGRVSPLCRGDAPRAINLKVATWTNRAEAVTCRRCLDELSFASGLESPLEKTARRGRR